MFIIMEYGPNPKNYDKRKFTLVEFSARVLSNFITVPSIFLNLGSSRFGNVGKLGCLVYLSGAQCTSLALALFCNSTKKNGLSQFLSLHTSETEI